MSLWVGLLLLQVWVIRSLIANPFRFWHCYMAWVFYRWVVLKHCVSRLQRGLRPTIIFIAALVAVLTPLYFILMLIDEHVTHDTKWVSFHTCSYFGLHSLYKRSIE